MIWATGDTHRNFTRFTPAHFPEMMEMVKSDITIVAGDFGAVWHGDRRDDIQLALLEDLPFTVAFVDGNHENFDALAKYPIEEWNGGKVQFIRPHVIHLMRGQIFTLEGRTFFTMGGASSHDIEDGILDMNDPNFRGQYIHLLREDQRHFRIRGRSWWPEELPSAEEYAEARRNLDAHGWTVDYIITHSPPTSFAAILNRPRDELTDFLEEIHQRASYQRWLFGHCHGDRMLDEKHQLVYKQILRLI